MKKIKLTTTVCLLLAAVICASCTADTTGETDGVSATQGAENTVSESVGEAESEDKVALLYSASSLSSNISNDEALPLAREGTILRSYDNHFNQFDNKSTIREESELLSKKSITIAQKTYTADYKQSIENGFMGNDYTEYETADPHQYSGTTHLLLSDKDNSVMMFSWYPFDENKYKGDLTEAEARIKADAVLLELYGQEAAEKYQYYTTILNKYTDATYYVVVYAVMPWGYMTDDNILIIVDTSGNIRCVRTPMLGYAYNAEQLFTKEDVEAAMAVVEANLPENYKRIFTQIKIDADGKYYVE